MTIISMNLTKPEKTDIQGSLAIRLRFARERKGWTQDELARAVGTSQQVINKIEKGKTKKPRGIEAIAKALDVSPAWLQFGIEEIDALDRDAVMLALSWMNLEEPQKSALQRAILDMAKKPKKS